MTGPVFPLNISTHGLTRRPTKSSRSTAVDGGYFNSRPHEEADRTKGSGRTAHFYFNSRPHEEADAFLRRNNTQTGYFNSRPHEEADRGKKYTDENVRKFQLTASRGGRRRCRISGEIHIISTHGLTRRPTFRCPCYVHTAVHFNSRPHEEADDKKEELDEQQNYFNSRPHEEADHL